jgi:hypothetical protein
VQIPRRNSSRRSSSRESNNNRFTPKLNKLESPGWNYENNENIDSLLLREQENQILNNKMSLFSAVIDLELLADLSEIYSKPWTSSYKEAMQSLFKKGTPV